MNAERRRAAYKSGIDTDTGRRSREQIQIKIRKNKKEDALRKRRQIAGLSDAQDGSGGAPGCGNNMNLNKPSTTIPRKVTVADIPLLASILTNKSAAPDETLHAVVGLRRLLSIEKQPPVDAILEYRDILPKLVSYLSQVDSPTLIFESAWALTNVASTHQTAAVVDAGAVPPLLWCLHHESADIREQSAWCLGNIAGESCHFRDVLLQSGAMNAMVQNIEQPANPSLLGNVTWAISNLCRGKPAPDMSFVGQAIRPMVCLLKMPDVLSVDILVDAAWTISYLSDGDNSRIEAVMANSTAKTLVSLLEDKASPLVTPIVRCLGNFVTGTDRQTQEVIDAGFLTHAYDLLDSEKRYVRKETCWLLSNIAAGPKEQIQKLFMNRGQILRVVTHLALHDSDEVRRETLFVVCNIFTTGNDDQVKTLVSLGGLRVIAEALGKFSEPKLLLVTLDALDHILDVGQTFDKNYIRRFDEYGGIDSVERLQEHTSYDVYKAAMMLLDKHFGGEDIGDENLAVDENLAPMSDENTFTFNMPSKQLFTSPAGNAGAPQFRGNQAFNFGTPNFGTPNFGTSNF